MPGPLPSCCPLHTLQHRRWKEQRSSLETHQTRFIPSCQKHRRLVHAMDVRRMPLPEPRRPNGGSQRDGDAQEQTQWNVTWDQRKLPDTLQLANRAMQHLLRNHPRRSQLQGLHQAPGLSVVFTANGEAYTRRLQGRGTVGPWTWEQPLSHSRCDGHPVWEAPGPP